jgi:glycosyltransferase involved in cell wall biosynthesis
VPTGVDRVELAYLDQFLALSEPAFGIVRTPFGYLLIDRDGLDAFRNRLNKALPWGQITFMSRLGQKRDETVRQAESDLRRTAVGRARRGRVQAMLQQHVPKGFAYYNVGHSNLTDRMLGAVRSAGGQVHVLVHDVIPLEFPQFQRGGTVEKFRRKIENTARHADRIIYNSEDTRQRAQPYLWRSDRETESIVAHLGTIMPTPDPTGLPAGLPPKQPYFMSIGTIEPRKNHAFLLDIWEALGLDAPPLLICGNRGWQNEAVFARLNALPLDSPIREVPNLDDGALAHLLGNSAGLLFPSIAEGYGLPPVEALSLGARVLCNDLAVLREILGDKAVYASVNERYLWQNTITNWAKCPPIAQNTINFTSPTWDDHFKTVLRLR